MKKKKSFSFDTGKASTASNEKAVTAVLNQARQTVDTWPTRTQLQEPLDGQQSLFDQPADYPIIAPSWRRKTGEKRTIRKQLVISPTARKNLQERAENEDMSINECVNQLTAAAIRNRLQIHREKAPETKSLRLIFVTTPTMVQAIEQAAAKQDVSLNEFICFVLENSERIPL